MLEVLDIPDAKFGIMDGFIQNPKEMYNFILKLTLWEQFILGGGAKSPRLNKSYGLGYNYSGKVNAATAIPALYKEIGNDICSLIGYPNGYFNQVLLNYYRNGNDSIGMHSDSEASLGDNPRVASVSLGATRQFILMNKETKERYPLLLEDGQLLVMGSDSQLLYAHSIPKEPTITSGRISITFRHVV